MAQSVMQQPGFMDLMNSPSFQTMYVFTFFLYIYITRYRVQQVMQNPNMLSGLFGQQTPPSNKEDGNTPKPSS